MLSVDASDVVPVGVRPPPPLRGSSPCEAGQFFMAIRMANKTALWPPHGKQKGRYDPKNQNVMKCLKKQTICAVLDNFRDATFAQSAPNSGFSRDFFAQNGAFVQDFVSVFYFSSSLTGNFGAGTRNSKPRNSFFGAWNFFFRGSDEKIPVQKRFRGGSGGVFLSRWNFFPDTFPVSLYII